jgi:PAS domain S-box-containing protein
MQKEAAMLPPDFATRFVRDCAEAVIYADAEGKIRLWNGAATRIFGYSETEAIGASLDVIVPERLHTRHWDGYRAVMGGRASRYGANDQLAVPARRKDGQQISVEFTILPFQDENGAILGIAALLRDVTARFEEMRALRRELAAAKEQAAKA